VLALVLVAMPGGLLAVGEVGVVLGGLAFEVGPVLSGRLVAVQLFLVLLVRRVLRRVLVLALVLGVNVMVAIFGDFDNFLRKNWRFS
jgi:hypothetical protein